MEFKIRCSQIKEIMTNGKSKNDLLGKTCKTYTETWLKEQIYGFRQEITSKYFDKGNMMEAEAIQYYSDVKDLGFVLKNDLYFEDGHFTGTPDLILDDTVVDIKCPWDPFTFPLFDTEPDKGYWMQLQGYMHLTGRKKAILAYILMDTPGEIYGSNAHISYRDTPSEYRIKEFEFGYDPDFIETVKTRVEDCRNYIDTLLTVEK